MVKFTTRKRIIIVSILSAVFYIAQAGLDYSSFLNTESQLRIDIVKGSILAIFLYLGTFWALFFKVRGERLFTIMLFPSIGILVLSVLLQLIIVNFIAGIGQITLLALSFFIVALFTYINLLAVNILNISYLQNIPLAQAAKAVVFILSLIDSFLIFYMVFTNDINIFYRLGIVFIIVILLSYISLWSIDIKRGEKFLVSLTGALILTMVAFALSIWPISAPYLALAMTLILYILLNISLEMREIISRFIWIEYGIIFCLILLLMLILSEWGINGPLIN